MTNYQKFYEISVRYINKGAAEIRLGNDGSEPVIVEADSSPSKGNVTTVPIDILRDVSGLQPIVGASSTATGKYKVA